MDGIQFFNAKHFVQKPAYLAVTSHNWDNLWESRGGSMVNGAPREFPESTQCTP